ncbi:peptide ABC transporter permease [Vibrio nigripulchritudo]|nr:peptide ABC transporter permease [Vibrio nigripulchritudo]
MTDTIDFDVKSEVEKQLENSVSYSYWQLVRMRYTRKKYNIAAAIITLMVLLSAVFSGFFAPYSPSNKDTNAIYSPPQGISIWDDGPSWPYIVEFEESMDPVTFEITFVEGETKHYLTFFTSGDTWTLLGMEFDTHLFGVEGNGYIHILGTDSLGRDVFSRMMFGTEITLVMAFIVMILSGLIGIALGVSSGYFGGTYDVIIQRTVEFVKAFPDLPLILALVAILPTRSEPMTVFMMFAGILVLLRWSDLARELRGKVLSLRSVEYVQSAIAVGATDTRVLTKHIAPNMASHIIVWATYTLPEIILVESFISFLGVGVQAPMVSWGVMLNQIRDFQSFSAAPWLMAPVAMIMLSVLAFNAMGDGLRDAMDPHAND